MQTEPVGLLDAGPYGAACWLISSSSSARKRLTARRLTKSYWPIGTHPGTITRLIARPEDVEDVAQEVFLRLYFSLDQAADGGGLSNRGLHRLTVNAAYDYLRKQRRRQEYRMSDLSEQQVDAGGCDGTG
jgi:DNA-directed RNA polymerase specialized sigma24 family protein